MQNTKIRVWHVFTFLFVSLPPIILGVLFLWDSVASGKGAEKADTAS